VRFAFRAHICGLVPASNVNLLAEGLFQGFGQLLTEPVAAAPCGDSCGITLPLRRPHPSCRYRRPVLVKARLQAMSLICLPRGVVR
jgi:hypothetical protein